ncbi:MAG TPA: hypothetical protein PLQ56_18410 [Aggregatilineales bacterium]|nr:hypothetical protein [Aggregatilineales bacterium]
MLTNVLSGLVALLLIGVPLVIGIRCLLPPATPVSQAAGLLTLFPLVNALASILPLMMRPESSSEMVLLSVLIPGLVLGLLLMGWLYPDWRKGQLRGWLWVSAGLVSIHWLIVSVIWALVFYGVWYFYDSLDGINTSEPLWYGVPAMLIFVTLPILIACFNLWMLRRDAKQVNTSRGKG